MWQYSNFRFSKLSGYTLWNSCHNSTKLSEVNVKNSFTSHIVIYISDQITMLYLNTETGNRRLNIVDGMFSIEERG
jgi:hypothetical protein